MKKLIAMMLALILVVGLVACKKEKKTEEPKQDDQSQGQQQEQEQEQEEAPVEEEEYMYDESTDLPIVLDDGTILNPDGSPMEQITEVKLIDIWHLYGEEEKFPVIGGNMEANIMDKPGAWDLAYKDGLTTTLLIPAEQLANVTEAATMIHMMNTNTFTGGVVKLADGTDVAAFTQAVRDAVQNNQWLCGMPEKLVISDLGDGCILIAYGLNDTMTVFEGHLAAACPGAQSLYNEAIGG